MLQDFKIYFYVNFNISFYVNSHTNKLFEKWKRVSYFITVCDVVRKDDERETAVKGNIDGGWSSDDVVLWLGRRQNGDVVEWWGEWPKLRWHFYSSAEWESMRFGEGGRQRWCGFNASVLAREGRGRDGALSKDKTKAVSSSWLNWKEAWHGTTAWWHWSEERRYRGGERVETTLVGLTRILTGSKNKENSRGQFNCYKWIVKI
jgi:hypothetical protein